MRVRPVDAPGGLRLHMAPNALAHARIGLAVRGTRNAVERNRARRRLRAALTPHLDRLAGVDLVVTAPARVAVQPWTELVRGLARCLRKGAA